MDEVHWFIKGRKSHEHGVNTYIMTVVSREPRQILSFHVDNSVRTEFIQRMVDGLPDAKKYYVDGCHAYREVYYPGRLCQNFINKNDTYTVESINSDLRHYIPGLRRRSKIFYRTLETLRAVIAVFADAYNKFGDYKLSRKRIYKSVFDFL